MRIDTSQIYIKLLLLILILIFISQQIMYILVYIKIYNAYDKIFFISAVFIMIALFILMISPIEVILTSLPMFLYSVSYLIYLYAHVANILYTDILSTILLIMIISIYGLYRFRRKLKIRSFSNIFVVLSRIFYYIKDDPGHLLITEGLILLLLSSADILLNYITGKIFFTKPENLLGALIDGIFITFIRNRKIIFTSVFSWSFTPLLYYVSSTQIYTRPRLYREIFKEKSVVIDDVVVDKQANLMINVSTDLSPHMLVIGSTGTGKTVLSKKISRSLVKNNIPVIIFDLHNEYKDLGFKRLDPRDITGIMINDIYSNRDSLNEFIDVIRASFKLGALQTAYLQDLLTRYVEERRNIQKLPEYLEEEIKRQEDPEAQRVLRSLHMYLKLLFSEISEIKSDVSWRLDEPVTIDLSSVGRNNFLTDIYVYYFIRYIWRSARERGFTRNINQMIIIDEAHNILRGKIHELLSTIFREGRKFGLGLIVISQQISDEMSEYINNIGKIIIFRIVDMKTIEIFQKILDDENISRDLLRLRELEFYYIDLTGERQIFRGKILRI